MDSKFHVGGYVRNYQFSRKFKGTVTDIDEDREIITVRKEGGVHDGKYYGVPAYLLENLSRRDD